MPDILGLITARGGSKGVPGKNLAPIGGRPLIAWTIDAARACTSITRLVVSTDDPIVANASRSAGAEVPFMRPAALAADDSPHVDAVLHALDWLATSAQLKPDWLVLLQPTSPFRTGHDIDAAVQLALDRHVDAVVSVTESHDHPYLARRMDVQRALVPFIEHDIAYPRRQALPKAWALNGAVFVYRVATMLRDRRFPASGVIGYEMPSERSLQIDTPWDLKLARLIAESMEPARVVSGVACSFADRPDPHYQY